MLANVTIVFVRKPTVAKIIIVSNLLLNFNKFWLFEISILLIDKKLLYIVLKQLNYE